MIKSKNSKRRTTSYVDFRITEESEEENSDNEDLMTCKKVEIESSQDERGRNLQSSFQKNHQMLVFSICLL